MILRFKIFLVAFLALCFIVCASLIIPDDTALIDNTDRVFKVLESLGHNGTDHFPDTEIFGVSAKRGRQLVEEGFSTRPGGGKTRKQSKHFVCTSCHNVEKEDPDLRFSDPQARLEYTASKGLPFLQGTSLYGAVNREKFYNGDYYKKYGDLVVPARDNIREAIQLCAVECAQGRRLKPWEIESVLAYLWTIDLKISDLNMDDDQLSFVDRALKNRSLKDSSVALIKSRYLDYSPAHFVTAQESREAAVSVEGNTENGALIYDNSCLHCHENQRYSYFHLDDSKISFKYLKRKEDSYTDHSIYQVTRYGVKSVSGRRSYMPQYPIEKMSDQQLQDLRAYINERAD